ncbi:hypothetical protein DW322_18340 [Rhodococcus rhodnii]|uniref:Uncharacterized protein n=2 Tax=Rhodococcus rhodnii TaxID=38312 RepID=R7WQ49_9NOCA|nr:hypothetical protein [Rhodococcus rhodnii]EOM76129.1 hypothetical protein Rrhod_2495 [Rhodococcus rhodnii LMG 5362]TXG91784.1 hypothetical protein DW322_18340 [Rhodococcus rhodnii]
MSYDDADLSDGPVSPEVPEDDALEQATEIEEIEEGADPDAVAGATADVDVTGAEANVADVLEQNRDVPGDDDYPRE